MDAGRIEIKTRGVVIRKVLEDLPATREHALREGATFWHHDILPEHFTSGAKRKYAHTPRKRRYNARKRKYTGQAIDLIMSGDLLRRTKVLRLRANPERAKVILPAGFNRRNKNSAVRLRDEVTLIPRSDRVRVVDAYETAAVKRIRGETTTATQTITY